MFESRDGGLANNRIMDGNLLKFLTKLMLVFYNLVSFMVVY